MPRKMTSKDRVLTAIARREGDRVPVNYYGNEGINARLRKHFGLADNDGDGLLEALGVDFRGVSAPYVGPKLHLDIGPVKVDDWGIHRRWVEHESGGYWDFCDWPLANATEEQVEAWPMPNPDNFDYTAAVEQCRAFGRYCVTIGGSGYPDVINGNGMLRTMEQVLVDLISDDPSGLRLIDRRNAIRLEIIRRTLEAARGAVDLLCLGEDLGTQRGATLSPELFRRQIRPRIQPYVDLAASFDVPAMIHSCGSSSWAFDDFIDMGIAVVETLQPEAAEMAPAYLKKRFGGRLAFHGCISTAGPLAYGSVEDIVRNVRETLEVMMPGGGYILSPTHQIQDNSPTANVLAMYRTARKTGAYR